MAKKTTGFTQEEVAAYFKEHEYTLLSEYTGYNDKLMLKNKSGTWCWISLSNFKAGHIPENGLPPRDFMEENIRWKLLSEGYSMLSRYEDGATPIKVVNKEGIEYTVYWNTFKRGARPERLNRALSTDKVRKWLSTEGYSFKGVYKNAHTNIEVVCPNGHSWVTTYSNVKNGNRCPECNAVNVGGMSKGERITHNLLKDNPNLFTNVRREVTIDIEGSQHRLDFVFSYSGSVYAIEYDGEQHYKPSNKFGGEDALKITKYRDRLKDKYCRENNITLIRIPYTKNTVPDVTKYIEEVLGASLNKPKAKAKYLKTISDVAKYYLTHTIGETSNEFDVHVATVDKYFKTVYGKSKAEYLKPLVVEYYETHSSKETSGKYGVAKETINRWFKNKHGVIKKVYVHAKIGKEIADFYYEHNVLETALKFHIDQPMVYEMFKKYYGVRTKSELRPAIDDRELAEYYLTHSIEDTLDRFNICASRIREVFKQVYGKSKKDTIKGYSEQDIAEYYVSHSINEAKDKYGVSNKTVTRAFRKVYGMPKGEYIGLSIKN